MSKLRESHKRALSCSLFAIESNLQRIKASLSENTSAEQTVTYKLKDDLDSESKPKILETITEMLKEIKEMKDTFELDTEENSLRAEIRVALTEIWIILVDLEPERLKGYGELSESDKALIKPHVLSLQNKVENLRNLLGCTRTVEQTARILLPEQAGTGRLSVQKEA